MSIQSFGFTSRPLIERVKEHFRGKTVASDHIINCKNYKNENITVNYFIIFKEIRNKL